jgi:hypothetical protein
MKLKKSTLALSVMLPVLGLGLLAGNASAMTHDLFMSRATPEEIASRQKGMFEKEASLIGATLDEVKEAWAEGKTLRQLAEEKGITSEALKEKMNAQYKAQVKENLQSLVTQGVITQAQADKRLQYMSTLVSQKGKGRGKGGMFRRF